eukprot:CAMPEP_0206189524 /NCGR_PEP_ID=MMETSP0166-20121206/4217_1 /ASSEMBLY_ACC=CAM_ASM_000260 /TAXON_ID=95228 /ORGANISM="Vannella robusta, Strain DIVA3 518/3/11/1/6" /LENGTH=324 /DNA_ID=CAMNT_0053605451 /DNA_START=1336 /DNA_END=2308 /DNA_ORIENTATION=+
MSSFFEWVVGGLVDFFLGIDTDAKVRILKQQAQMPYKTGDLQQQAQLLGKTRMIQQAIDDKPFVKGFELLVQSADVSATILENVVLCDVKKLQPHFGPLKNQILSYKTTELNSTLAELYKNIGSMLPHYIIGCLEKEMLPVDVAIDQLNGLVSCLYEKQAVLNSTEKVNFDLKASLEKVQRIRSDLNTAEDKYLPVISNAKAEICSLRKITKREETRQQANKEEITGRTNTCGCKECDEAVVKLAREIKESQRKCTQNSQELYRLTCVVEEHQKILENLERNVQDTQSLALTQLNESLLYKLQSWGLTKEVITLAMDTFQPQLE